MQDKEKRKHIRTTLISEVMKVTEKDVDKFRSIRDISLGGVYINDLVSPPGSNLTLTAALPGDLGDLTLTLEVVRCDWAKLKNKKTGIACKFIGVTEGQGKILDAYIKYLRNRQIVTVSKRIIEDFFGKQPPRL